MDEAIVAGFDWGARTANVMAAEQHEPGTPPIWQWERNIEL